MRDNYQTGKSASGVQERPWSDFDGLTSLGPMVEHSIEDTLRCFVCCLGDGISV